MAYEAKLGPSSWSQELGLGMGRAIPEDGSGLRGRLTISWLTPEWYSSCLQPASILVGRNPSLLSGVLGFQAWAQSTCPGLSAQGLVPLRWGCALPSPNAPGKAPNHIHTTLRWGRAPGTGSIPGLGRSPGEGKCYPLQYSCLENPRDRGA